jgi:carbon catabolite-derepressing protein kinase
LGLDLRHESFSLLGIYNRDIKP